MNVYYLVKIDGGLVRLLENSLDETLRKSEPMKVERRYSNQFVKKLWFSRELTNNIGGLGRLFIYERK